MSIENELTCTRCNEVQETYSEIVYSRGDRVCLDCKKESKRWDDHSFDRDMALRESPRMLLS